MFFDIDYKVQSLQGATTFSIMTMSITTLGPMYSII
jgi:hypothetical protein